MKYISQSFAILLALFACAFLPVHAASLDDLTWTTTDGEVTIIDCKIAATGELVIPETVEGNPVTSIGEEVFSSCVSLKGITIGNGVTNIGDGAFGGCDSLTSVTFLGDAPKIGDSAFDKSSPTIYREADAKGWGDTLAGRPVKLVTEKP